MWLIVDRKVIEFVRTHPRQDDPDLAKSFPSWIAELDQITDTIYPIFPFRAPLFASHCRSRQSGPVPRSDNFAAALTCRKAGPAQDL